MRAYDSDIEIIESVHNSSSLEITECSDVNI